MTHHIKSYSSYVNSRRNTLFSAHSKAKTGAEMLKMSPFRKKVAEIFGYSKLYYYICRTKH